MDSTEKILVVDGITASFIIITHTVLFHSGAGDYYQTHTRFYGFQNSLLDSISTSPTTTNLGWACHYCALPISALSGSMGLTPTQRTAPHQKNSPRHTPPLVGSASCPRILSGMANQYFLDLSRVSSRSA
jgi:hypothetical protein